VAGNWDQTARVESAHARFRFGADGMSCRLRILPTV
jgi:hypothetical protein